MNQSLALVSTGRSASRKVSANLAQRLVLYSNELYRVPACYRTLRIKAGTAYITQAGSDRILQTGQTLQLDSLADVALVSALRSEQVVLELYSSPAV